MNNWNWDYVAAVFLTLVLLAAAVVIGVLLHRQRQTGNHHVGVGGRRASLSTVGGMAVSTVSGGNGGGATRREPEPDPEEDPEDNENAHPTPPRGLAVVDSDPPVDLPDDQRLAHLLDRESRQRFYPGMRGSTRLTEPPMVEVVLFRDNVDHVSLRDALAKHHPKRDGVWDEVVVEFYNGAAKIPWIAGYFGLDVSEDGQIRNMSDDIAQRLRDLQRHFLANLLIVGHSGVTVATVRGMWKAHREVRDLHGDPITGDVYDVVIGALAGVITQKLVECGVKPGPVIAQLGVTIEPLRQAIVHGEAA